MATILQKVRRLATMATINLTTIVEKADITAKRLLLQFTGGAANNTGNDLRCTLPQRFAEARLVSLSVLPDAGAATAHAPLQTEGLYGRVLRASQELVWQTVIAQGTVRTYSTASWQARSVPYPFGDILLVPGDIVEVSCPAIDDGGVPTGTYRVTMIIEIVTWR